jgi:hypothetical protein
MNGCQTRVYKFEKQADVFSRFRCGVSLHSHTMHSKEYLGRLPTYIAKFPIGSYILEREIGRLHLYEGRIFNFKKVYWTPPLSPREAHELEKQQIKKTLGLRALVSLSDHDSVEAGLHLRMLAGTSRLPFPWSGPCPLSRQCFTWASITCRPIAPTHGCKNLQHSPQIVNPQRSVSFSRSSTRTRRYS